MEWKDYKKNLKEWKMVKYAEKAEKKAGIDMYKYAHHLTVVIFKMSSTCSMVK